MEPQDDPEARIRELERPLTDQARTSELGVAHTGGYSFPPTPPPAPYGAAFPRPPRRSTSGFGGWWIVLAAGVVGVLALAAGIAVYTAQRFSNGNSIVVPSISMPSIPSPGSRTQSPTTPPSGGSLSISGAQKNETIACNDSSISVSGFSNTIVLTGHCASLTVSGVQNMVIVDDADAITASGFNNQVTFHSGSPRINKSGDGNVVQQG